MTPFEAAAIGGHMNVVKLLTKYTTTEIDAVVLSKIQRAEEMSNAKARAKILSWRENPAGNLE